MTAGRMAPLSSLPPSSFSPQAGYITVNYDYELWAEPERQGARFLTGPGGERLSVQDGLLVDNAKNKEETCRLLCVLNPRRRSDACKGENGRGRELRP